MKKNVLITGSSSGFGDLTARTLLDHGHTVVATMRDPDGRNRAKAEALRRAGEAAAGEVVVLELDVTDEASVERAVAEALEVVGPLDAVVNNAGYGVGGFAEAFSAEELTRILDVNVVGVQRVNRAVLPSMRARGEGLLVHVSTTLGRIVLPFCAPYVAAKFALEGLAESYRYELAPTGIEVAVVEPGGFGTNFFANMQAPADEARTVSYGDLGAMPEQLWGGVSDLIQGDDAPDPQEVADAIHALVEAEPGTRPFRVVVDPMTGGDAPRAINDTTEAVQRQLLEAMHLGSLMRPSIA